NFFEAAPGGSLGAVRLETPYKELNLLHFLYFCQLRHDGCPGLQRFVNGAFVCDFEQLFTHGRIERTLDGDRPLKAVDLAGAPLNHLATILTMLNRHLTVVNAHAHPPKAKLLVLGVRSEERRVGKECMWRY